MRRVVALASIFAIVLGAVPVRGDAIEARYFDERARAEFARHHYEAALELFLQVQLAAPSAGTLYNIGVSADNADEPAVAYTHLHEFVVAAGGDDPAHRADAESRMHRLEQSLALVEVSSDPPGATVWVDRRELGSWGETPRTLVLEPGSHVLELSLEGHRTERVEVVAVRGEAHEVERTLTAELGAVRVEGAPDGTQVIAIDARGVEHAILGASAGAELPVGRYRLRAELAGHRPDEREVAIHAGATEVVHLAPTPIPVATGRLLVTAGEIAATVIVDGAPRGETPLRIDGIAEGERAIEIRADGYVTWRGAVPVTADRSAFVDVTLVPTTER
jgi:outer membrane receptor for ferrienterochelin and colicins